MAHEHAAKLEDASEAARLPALFAAGHIHGTHQEQLCTLQVRAGPCPLTLRSHVSLCTFSLVLSLAAAMPEGLWGDGAGHVRGGDAEAGGGVVGRHEPPPRGAVPKRLPDIRPRQVAAATGCFQLLRAVSAV